MLGMPRDALIGTIDPVDALKKGLTDDDPRIARQRLAIDDAFASQGRARAATDVYDKVAKQAAAKHWPDVQGGAMLRGTMLWAVLASVDASTYGSHARRRARELRATTDPALRP